MNIGDIDLKWLGHASFMIKNHRTIYIDPYKLNKKYEEEKADIILITHSHYDHCSIEDIKKIVKPGTTIIVSPDAQSKITRIQEGIEMQIMTPGDKIEVKGTKIEAIPAYNNNKEYHPKSEGWNGYLIKFSGMIIYHSGDTDVIPEMKKLSGYGKKDNGFVALLPVGGKYTMNPQQALQAVKDINPDLAIPMHWGEIVGSREDAEKFIKLCKEEGHNAVIIEKEK